PVPYCLHFGSRWPNYTLTANDYNIYVEARREFLLSDRGYLALHAGGIIARLARLVIPCPTYEARRAFDPDDAQGILRVSSVRALVYDCLTEEEEDLICGVYAIATSTASGKQERRLSWWPQPAAFAQSGHNVGWWTHNCEDWFHRQLDKMEAGQAVLRTQQQWRSHIAF
ncbi:hypothetical protein GGX14DRAFT_299719, partial [Mycena pura]